MEGLYPRPRPCQEKGPRPLFFPVPKSAPLSRKRSASPFLSPRKRSASPFLSGSESCVGGTVRAMTKRRQPGPRPCYGAPRALPAVSLRCCQHGGPVGVPPRQGATGPAGVEEHGIGPQGFPGNLGRPCGSMSISIGVEGRPTPTVPGPRPASGLSGAKTGARDGTANRTTRKGGWRVRRESERLIVASGVGEPVRREPCRAKGAPRGGIVGGQQVRDSGPWVRYT
jgi:hypothetical protein